MNAICPACRQGRLQDVTRLRTYRPHGRPVTVELLGSQCDRCGTEVTRAAQHDQNLVRLAARKAQYGSALLGEEIVSLRKRYGLTVPNAAKIFGKSSMVFRRYENETAYPDQNTRRLLKLAIERPTVLQWLAQQSSVDLPLWAARCEDALLKRGDGLSTPRPGVEVAAPV